MFLKASRDIFRFAALCWIWRIHLIARDLRHFQNYRSRKFKLHYQPTWCGYLFKRFIIFRRRLVPLFWASYFLPPFHEYIIDFQAAYKFIGEFARVLHSLFILVEFQSGSSDWKTRQCLILSRLTLKRVSHWRMSPTNVCQQPAIN